MKAFLLAAGYGTRLRPLTDKVPKCLLPIRGVPMLRIWLDLCKQHGISEILVNLHFRADAVRDFMAANKNGIKVHLVEESTLQGSAGTLFANRHWVASESAFWVFYADVLTNVDLGRILAFHEQRSCAATMGVYQVPDPARCGIAQLDDSGVIRQFVEKPKHPAGNWAFSGVLLGTPELLDEIPERQPVDLGFDVFPRLAGRMYAYAIREYLLDIGSMANYELAQRTWPGLTTACSAITAAH